MSETIVTFRQRMAQNWSAGLVSQIFAISGPLLLTPLFLKHWGVANYGIWLTYSAAATYLSTLDFGAQSYITNLLTQLFARKDFPGVNRLIGKALTFTLCLAGIGLALALPCSLLDIAPASPLYRTPRLLITLLALQVLGGLPLGVLMGTYRACGDYARSELIWSCQRALTTGLVASALIAGKGPEVVAAVCVLPILGFACFVVWDLEKRFPQIEVGLSRLSLSDLREWCSPSLQFFGVQLLQVASVQGPVLVVGWILGPTAVAVFVSTRALTNLIRTATTMVRNGVLNELTAIEARGEWHQVRRVHGMVSVLNISIAFAGFAFLHFCGGDLLTLWSRGTLSYDARFGDLLLAGALVEATWGPYATVLLAGNRPRTPLISMAVAACVGIATGTVLLTWMNLSGMALGLIVGDLISTAWMVPLEACRVLGESLAAHARQLVAISSIMLLGFWVVMIPLSQAAQNTDAIIRVAGLAVSSAMIAAVIGSFFLVRRWRLPSSLTDATVSG